MYYFLFNTPSSKPPRLVKPRNLEIYRLHTVEKKTIHELAECFVLSQIRIWGICKKTRKRFTITK